MEEKLRKINERMRRIDRDRMRIIDRVAGDLGILPSQHYVLLQLGREGRVASQAQIADMLHVSPARVTLVIKQLVAEDYITRESGADGRRNEISITEKGRDVLAKSRALFNELNEACYAGFSAEEIAQFYDYLERVLDNLKKFSDEVKEREEQ